jgi:hydroxymethylbilane synthase
MRLGTRGSALALAQSKTVAQAIRERTGQPVELVEIVTAGDRSAEPVQRLGIGVFVSALRDALLAKEIDVAVHSYKDLPTAPAEGLVVAAVPPRENPRDVLVARDGLALTELPAGARVGTGAVRRIAQLHALGRGLEPVPIRGNVDTRLRKVSEGALDAVVLALAGLTRLGRAAEATEILEPEVMLPAPAQGALAVECRLDDPALVDALSTVDDPGSRAAVDAERALLATLEAGCSAPVAGLAEPAGAGQIHLRGAVFSPDGRTAFRLSRTGTLADAATLGRLLAGELLDAGADRVLGVQ